jgi:hypothetical protein
MVPARIMMKTRAVASGRVIRIMPKEIRARNRIFCSQI